MCISSNSFVLLCCSIHLLYFETHFPSFLSFPIPPEQTHCHTMYPIPLYSSSVSFIPSPLSFAPSIPPTVPFPAWINASSYRSVSSFF